MQQLLHAFEFAERGHRGQVRKYTGEPYIVHPMEVARIVGSVTEDEAPVIAALFHDLVEDTPITLPQIASAFGNEVAQLVHEVTDVSRPYDGNRWVRKTLDRQHLSRASHWGKTIKLADMISNTQSIVQHDPDFAKVYLKEKELLLPALIGGHSGLWERANSML